MRATLPFESPRRFSLLFYWTSHGLLLLRSDKMSQHFTQVDILFQDVRWMTLPVWFEGIRIEQGKLSDIPLPLTKLIEKEAHLMSVFKVISQGVTHFVLASENVQVAEEQENYSENSPLLPNHDLRALTAPLWKDSRRLQSFQ